jgi:hypothetical protein
VNSSLEEDEAKIRFVRPGQASAGPRQPALIAPPAAAGAKARSLLERTQVGIVSFSRACALRKSSYASVTFMPARLLLG